MFYLSQFIGLLRWCIIITIRIVDIIHRPILYLKHNVWEKGFCLHLKVEPTQVDPIDGYPLFPETETEFRI
jgi:hypothetical protein